MDKDRYRYMFLYSAMFARDIITKCIYQAVQTLIKQQGNIFVCYEFNICDVKCL